MKRLFFLAIAFGVILLAGCTENQPVDYLNSKPNFEITQPKMNSTVSDTTTVVISSNIDNLVRVELYIDHYLSSDAVFQKPPYNYLWKTGYYEDGSQHILSAKGYDSNGGLTESKYVIVNIYRFMPSNLTAFLKADTLIQLNWIDNSSFETGFGIEEAVNDSNFVKIAEVDSNITEYSYIDTFNINEKYYFRVRAKSKDKFSGYSNIASAMLQLNSPTNLNIDFISDTAATFSWTDNNDFESGYVIYKRYPYGDMFIKEVPANSTETVVEDTFISGQYYNYLLYAKMDYLRSDPAIFPYVNFDFPAPINLELHGNNDHSITLNWESNNNYNTGFIIERKSENQIYNEIGRVSSNVHSFTDNNLDTNINYSYRLAEYSRYNKSNYSDDLQASYSSQLSQNSIFTTQSLISYLTVSDDGTLTAVGGYLGDNLAVFVYNTLTGQLISTCPAADSTTQIFQHVTISPNNSLLAGSGNNGHVTVWDINSGNVKKVLENNYAPNVLKFGFNGSYLIVERLGALRFYDTQTWQFDKRISTTDYIFKIALNKNSALIATKGEQTTIRLWDYNTGAYLKEIPNSNNALSIKFNEDGTKLYSPINNTLYIWDVNTASIIKTIPNFWCNRYIDINEKNDIAVGSYSFGISVCELSTGNYIQKFPPENHGVSQLYFTPDNNFLIAKWDLFKYAVLNIKKGWISPNN